MAFLVAQSDPRRRKAIRPLLRSLGPQPDLAPVAQALIRAKLMGPQDYVRLRARVEGARQACPGCGVGLVILSRATRPCARCGTPLGPNPGRGGEGRPATTRRDSSRGDPPARGPKSPGRIGPYPILRRIGQGGMGTIYLARDRTGREVALKRLLPGISHDGRERFRREAEAIARLQHPGIVAIHDIGVDEETQLPYYTMDYVAGRELAEVRAELSQEQLLVVVQKVALGLHYAHEQGIVHRDVKPQNILIDARGEPRIADFGLARDLGRSSLTEDGDLVGTPLFMAPEQLTGETGHIDRRTDVYALGVLLYEGLTGTLPIEASSFFELQQRVQKEIPAPPSSRAQVSPELDRIVLKALEKQPDHRYPSAEDLALDIGRYLRGESVEASAVSYWGRAKRVALDRLASPWAWVGVALVLCSLLVAGAATVYWRQASAAAALAAAREARREEALGMLRAAQEALESAQANTQAAPEVLAELDEVQRRAEAADAARRELGAEAPTHLERDLAAVRTAAERLRALTLARGDAPARADARRRLRALLAETGDSDLRLTLGRLELEAGHLRAAQEQLNEVLKRSGGKQVEAFYLRGEAHRRAGAEQFALLDYGRALAERERLVAVRPARVLAAKALALVARGEDEPARRSLEEAQRLEPDEPHLVLVRAALAEREQGPEEALATLVFGVRAFPEDGRLRLACGRAWAALGDPERALKELERALALGLDPMARIARARLLALLGRDAEAEAALREVLSAAEAGDPSARAGSLVLARLERARGQGPAGLALLEPFLQDRPPWGLRLEAAELLLAEPQAAAWGRAEDLVRPLSESTSQPWQRVGRARRLLVAASLRRGNPDAAWGRLQPLIGTDDAQALTLAAEVKLARGEADAESARERALEAQRVALNAAGGLDLEVSDPADEAFANLLRGRRLLARAERASPTESEEERAARAAASDLGLVLLQRTVRLAPWLASAHEATGEALANQGQSEAALGALQAGWPTVRALALRAALWAQAGDHARAIADLEAALARAPAETPSERRLRARLLLTRARSRIATGAGAAALADLDAATEADGLLVDAFAERSRLRLEHEDSPGAEEDRKRVFLLREGYVEVFQDCREQAWRTGLGPSGDHIDALRALEPAFAAVSRERDPERRAELHLVRAYMRLRAFQIAGALIDLSAMLELGPARSAFRQIYDEVIGFRGAGRLALKIEPIVAQILSQRDVQDETTPDFLQAFCAFIHVEFGGEPCPQARLRAGLAAVERYLERRPAHSAGLLMRAALLLEDGRTGAALATVSVVLEERQPPGYAHFLLARIQALQRDPAAGLRSLEAAVVAGFDVFQRFQEDPALAPLRAHPRYGLVVGIAQARSALAVVERGEQITYARDEATRQRLSPELLTQLATGLGYLREHLGRREAQSAAGALYLLRSRLEARVGEGRPARRDLAGALELAPELMVDLREVASAYDGLQPLTSSGLRDLEPAKGELYPTELREAIPSVLALLLGGEVPDEKALKRAARLVQAQEATRIYLSVVRLAEGEPKVALRIAREELAQQPALGAWFEARALLALGQEEEAFAALRRGRAAGLRGPLRRDPALAGLAGQERFKLLLPQLPLAPARRWSSR